MNASFVIFGRAHAGKSTLIGLLRARTVPSFDLTKYDAGVRSELGANYRPENKYAYIVDTAKDERERILPEGRAATPGHSLYMHTDVVTLGNDKVSIIDTPGSEHSERQRIKGMFYGDVGVFMIDAAALADPARFEGHEGAHRLTLFFTPLFLWSRMPNRPKPIVVLSKMDETGVEFSEAAYARACAYIRKVSGEAGLEPIPVAVIVGEDREHNILTRSQCMPWYKGPTFVEKLNDIGRRATASASSELFAVTDRMIPGYQGYVVRAKILRGSVEKGRSIRLMPVLLDGRQDQSIGAVVSSISWYGAKEDKVEVGMEGSVFGITITDLQHNKRRITDCDVTNTTCLVGRTSNVCLGNILEFAIDRNLAEEMKFLEPVQILWFGRLVSAQVVRRTTPGTSGIITVELQNRWGCMLLDAKQKPLFQRFLLKRLDSFHDCRLHAIGVAKNVVVRNPGVAEWIESLPPAMRQDKREVKDGVVEIHKPSSVVEILGEMAGAGHDVYSGGTVRRPVVDIDIEAERA